MTDSLHIRETLPRNSLKDCETNSGSAGALARIERAARTITWAPFFSRLARAAHACADEGVRAPSIRSPRSTLVEFWGKLFHGSSCFHTARPLVSVPMSRSFLMWVRSLTA